MTFYKFTLEFKKKKIEQKIGAKKTQRNIKETISLEWMNGSPGLATISTSVHMDALDCFELPLPKLSITNERSQCVSSKTPLKSPSFHFVVS